MKRANPKHPAPQVIGRRTRERGDSRAASKIRFRAKLLRPAAATGARLAASGAGGGGGGGDRGAEWTFLIVPKEASAKLPSRGMVSVEGTINGSHVCATLEPDGQGGHWLKVDRKLREAARAAGGSADAGDIVTLEITPVPPEREPEPEVPPDLRKALAAAPKKAREVWSDITPAARRDFIHWIVSGKRAETRVLRIDKACDMLAKGKRRPCCFDRSGMYDKSLTCPVALEPDDESSDAGR